MLAPLSICAVKTRADFRTFMTFRWKLYAHDPHWVPPLLPMERHKLDREHNPGWQHMEGEYFVAWRGDEPVGTIAAVINHRHNEYHNERIGFFGMFDTYDDQAAADALLETAAGYVRDRGYDALRGPVNFSTNDECGLLIEGFDDPPVIFMPYNYAYYPRLLDNAPGFAKVMDLYSYRFTLNDTRQSPNLQRSLRVTQRNNARRQIRVRPIDRRHVNQELATLRTIYNHAWEKNWGFVPMSDAELDALIHDLGQYLDPRLAYFAEVAGQPAGFVLAVPDLNQALRRAYARPGKPHLLTLLQAAWHWKIRPKIDRIRIAFLGVSEKYRGIGIEAALFARLFEEFGPLSLKVHWHSADGGWVLETNTALRRLVEPLGGELYKRYRIYERLLRPDYPEAG